MDIRVDKKVAFVSMSGRDSAMWFSFTGLYHALKDNNIPCEFYFPSVEPSAEVEYNKNCFFYRLRQPLKSLNAVIKLAKVINNRHDRVVIFSQGIFSALLVFFLKRDVEVITWIHEIDNYVSRSGFLRGINYLISDHYMASKTEKTIVASDTLYHKATTKLPSKFIINSCLPLSGDFHSLLSDNLVTERHIKFDKNNFPIKVLFFGGISAYKGLHHLSSMIKFLPEGMLSVRIIGRGDLKKLAPELYNLSLLNNSVQWINRFASAQEVVEELKNADLMYAMYDSVTATSLIDIANAFGVPVLVSELPFFKDKIKDGINGFVVNRMDVVDFFQKRLITYSFRRELITKHFYESGLNKKCVNSLVAGGVVSTNVN